jgi:hypothetical protein
MAPHGGWGLVRAIGPATDWRGKAKFEATVMLGLRAIRSERPSALFENFAADEMTLLIEMVVELSVN